MTLGRGVCCAAARNAASTSLTAPPGVLGTMSRYCAPGAMPSRSVSPDPRASGRCTSCGSGAIIEKSRPTSVSDGSSPQDSPHRIQRAAR